MNRPTIARFLGQAAIWGSSFTLIKVALHDVSPSQLVLGRLILGAAVLAVFAVMTKVSLKMSRRAWRHVAISAIFANVVPYLLLSYGEQHASASVAGVLIGGTPLVTLLIATVALREESANRRSVAGFLIGFIGVVLVLSPWAAGSSSVAGSLACFGAAVSYAVGYVYVRKFLSPLRIKPVTLATNQLVSAAVIQALITALFPWHPIAVILPGAIASIVLLGALSTGFANILYFRLIQDVGASTAAAVDYIVPIFATLFGFLLLAEPITWNVITGGSIVLLGMAIAEGRLRHHAHPTHDIARCGADTATGS
jgi:drug/metabolite transporter (DMT)-like permease